MLATRIHEPSENQIIYHYCSAATFQAIFESGKLRFTDVNMLNDSMETRWGYSVFEEAATRLMLRVGISDSAREFKKEFFDAVDKVLSRGQQIAHPFVSCLSLEGDSLDQWCKYADDGSGYAIGFDANLLKKYPLSLLSVLYDFESQVKEMMDALVTIHSSDPSFPLKGEAFNDVAFLATFMTALKHPSFVSEKEVRCVRAVNLVKAGEGYKFHDYGGIYNNKTEVPGEKVRFLSGKSGLTAYLDIPYIISGEQSPIVEVVIGPKNRINDGNVFLFLASVDQTHVNLRRSIIPYQ